MSLLERWKSSGSLVLVCREINNYKVNVMIIFKNLTVGHPWKVKDSRYFTWDEANSVLYAEVVSSQFGMSVCFHLNTGKTSYIPLSSNSTAYIGDIIDPVETKVITLYNGDMEIIRIEI